MTTTPNFRALAQQLAEQLRHAMDFTISSETYGYMAALIERTNAALATPPPEPPTVMQILELSGEIEDAGLGQIDLVRAAIERWGAK